MCACVTSAAPRRTCTMGHDAVGVPAAVHGEYAAPPTSGSLYSEADWNETSTAEGGQAYHLSKARHCSAPPAG